MASSRPKSSQLALLVPVTTAGIDITPNRDGVLTLHDGHVQYVNDLHPFYEALHYVVLFPNGVRGWSEQLKSESGVSERDAYRMMYKTNDSCKTYRNDVDILAETGALPDHADF